MLKILVGLVIILGFVTVNTLFLVWLERKIAAHIQQRLGPMRTGWHGSLQTIADTLKLLAKEDVVPQAANKLIFFLAPILVVSGALLGYIILPFSKEFIVANLSCGVIYIFAVASLGPVGITLAGWASNNKYSLLGGMRSAAQLVSYEIVLILSVLGPVMLSGSLSTVDIVLMQKNCWFILPQACAFVIFLIASIAELNRTPFDIPEAEAELVAGFHTEYSGIKFSMFFLAEYMSMFALAALATVLFLGGWLPPPLLNKLPIPGICWFLIKTYFIIFIFMWVRWTFPRVRVDQLMALSWKVLIPLAFVNILLTGIGIILWQNYYFTS